MHEEDWDAEAAHKPSSKDVEVWYADFVLATVLLNLGLG